ncbi:DMT family transporter, partial [Methylogaea oryzae]
MNALLLPLLAFAGGLAIAMQAGINAGLARHLGGSLPAAAVSF